MSGSSSTSDSRRSVAPLLAFARAWKDGACPTVEEYLAAHHPAGVSVDDLLDLVQQEIVSREARGEVPAVADFQRRFASHADHIGALFEVNALFTTGPAGGAGPEGPDLADYEVEGRLAAGGMGEIYGARDASLGRRVAVKVLRPEWQDDAASVARFWGEARTTARLQHPGIVPVYEAGVDARDRPFIAMKLVEGRTLAALLADRPTPGHDLTGFIGIFEHVCHTLAYAHTQGVIHRDLKPANVMVGGFDEVQVMDWGLAKRLGDSARTAPAPTAPVVPGKVESTVPHGGLTVAGEMIGTPGYMPPEQARGDHDRVGPASDVFGLGAILCEILTGRPPFDTVARARAGDLAPARDRLAWVTGEADLVRLALDCLAPDPVDRPADAGAVCVALAAYRTGLRERVRQAELTAVKATAERKARRRAEVLRLLAVLFVIAAGLGAWGWSQHQADLGRDVAAALDEARAARETSVTAGGDPVQAAHADKALHRAEGLMHGLSGRADLRERHAALVAEREGDAADPKMVRRLDEIRVAWTPADPGRVGPGVGRMYANAFRDYGIDVTALDPDEAARRITARAIRADLVTALDYWGLACLTARAPEPAGRQALAVARAADPDPWRNRLRTAVAAADFDALRGLAREAASADLPVPVLVVLGSAVADQSTTDPKSGWAGRPTDDPAGLTLLRLARRRGPTDFWANYHLANALLTQRRPQYDEAARYLTAAVAVRPTLPGLRSRLAYALRQVGDLPSALAASHDEVLARPGVAAVHTAYAGVLMDQGEYGRARAVLDQARALDPNAVGPRGATFDLLMAVGDTPGAEAEARDAIARNPADRVARSHLAQALATAGRWADAKAVAELAHAGSPDPERTARAVKAFDQDAATFARLAAAPDPVALRLSPDETWGAIRICAHGGLDRAAVRLAERAWPRGPAGLGWFAERLTGIVAAVRLGTGPAGDPAERARYRLLALTWLRAELALRAGEIQSRATGRAVAARRALRIWEQHQALAGVRDPDALAARSGLERAGWQKFWADVAAQVRAADRGR